MSNRKMAFLGQGLSYPIEPDQHGRIAMVGYEEAVRRSIFLILMTRPGERKMRPTFGCRIHELIFGPLDATSFGLAAYFVRDALEMWEPRIRLENVQAFPDSEQTGQLLIEVEYTHLTTNDRRNLVFPFFLIAEE